MIPIMQTADDVLNYIKSERNKIKLMEFDDRKDFRNYLDNIETLIYNLGNMIKKETIQDIINLQEHIGAFKHDIVVAKGTKDDLRYTGKRMKEIGRESKRELLYDLDNMIFEMTEYSKPRK